MVVGNGDIASVLPKRDDLLFFASGVSNSQSINEQHYDREVKLLLSQDDRAHCVYFSSLSVFYKETRYTRHKRFMEVLVKETFRTSTIIRLGNILWGNNPHTLINYFRKHPDAPIKDTYRYVITKEEFLHWLNLIPEWSCEMNCPGTMMKVKDIKEKYCGVNQ